MFYEIKMTIKSGNIITAHLWLFADAQRNKICAIRHFERNQEGKI